jgi:early secretory antigenic target protein ESAT-6
MTIMSGSTEVNFGGLDATSSTIGAKAKTIRARLDQLDSDLAPMRASWDGFARDAYHAAQSRWNAAAEDLNLILQAVGISVNDANTGYQDTEKLNTNMW